MNRYTVEQVKNNHIDVTAKMIRESGYYRKFAVVEDGDNQVITIGIETIDEEIYLGGGEYKKTDVTYYAVSEGQNDLDWYGDLTVEDFVDNYLSACTYVAIHWTVGA